MARTKLSQIWLSDDEIIVKWFKYCMRNGLIYIQPSNLMERDEKYVHLTNCNGEIVRFNLNNHRFEFGND